MKKTINCPVGDLKPGDKFSWCQTLGVEYTVLEPSKIIKDQYRGLVLVCSECGVLDAWESDEIVAVEVEIKTWQDLEPHTLFKFEGLDKLRVRFGDGWINVGSSTIFKTDPDYPVVEYITQPVK